MNDRDYLLGDLRDDCIPWAYKNIKVGDSLSLTSDKSGVDKWYEIDVDDIKPMSVDEVCNRLPDPEGCELTYRMTLFGPGSDEAFFSDVLDLGLGFCMEKSILFQLANQASLETYLVLGSTVRGDKWTMHAYNIVVEDDVPRIVDCQQPYQGNHTFEILKYSTDLNREGIWTTVPNLVYKLTP